jgi:F0F1-type ATP synthase membrane subunit b/b'
MREQGDADNTAATARFAELHDRLARQIAEAEKRIAAQRDDVMASLEQMAKDIGQDVYAKLAGQPADPAALEAKVAAAAKGGSR